MNMKTRLIAIAALCIALCATLNSEQAADSLTAASAANVRVELVAVHSEDGQYISVSPDGRKIAVSYGRLISILDSSTMEAIADTADQDAAFDPNSFCWSPDSKRAALVEDFIRQMRDSDLWIMEIEEGRMSRLFADEIKDILRAEKGNAVIAPIWSADGEYLFAALFDYSKRSGAIARVDSRDERTAEIVYADRPGSGAAIWTGLHFAGDCLFFSRDAPKRNDAGDGIYRTRFPSGESGLILRPDEVRGEPILIDIGADGKYALASYLAYSGVISSDFLNPASGEYESGIFLIDLSDFSTRPLAKWKNPESRLRVNYAAFSRDGSKVVYVVSEKNAGHRLMIQDSGGGEEHVLFPSEIPSGYVFGTMSLRTKPPIFWTADDRLFVIGGNGRELFEFRIALK